MPKVPFVTRRLGARRARVPWDERREPALRLAVADRPGRGEAAPPDLAESAAAGRDAPLGWGAGLSILAHGAVLALAIALVSFKPTIEPPDPIPIEIVYASSPSPSPAHAAAPMPPQKAAAPPAPSVPPQTLPQPAPPPPAPKPAETVTAVPAPDGLAVPESKQATEFIPPLPPERPKYVPPPPRAAPTAPPQKHFPIFAPGFKPPAAPAKSATPPAPALAQGAPSEASPGRASPRTTPPVYAEAELGNRPPIYPPLARENGWEGHVLLRAKVGPDGALDDVALKDSSGFDILDEAALKAVRVWRFRPARLDGKPVASEIDIGFTFRLKDGG